VHEQIVVVPYMDVVELEGYIGLGDGEGAELGRDGGSSILVVVVRRHGLDRKGREGLRIEELVVRKLRGV
jgi:hypothetical protein